MHVRLAARLPRYIVMLLFVLAGATTRPVAAAGVPSVMDPRYFAGANVAWFNWGCDFGCADKGVASKATNAALSDAFNQLKAAGIHTVRWWTFEGDATQINRDSSGAPTGLKPSVYVDFDAALALADKYDLVFDFVLFSAQTGLPSTWFTNPDQRQKLANALVPLFDRYKNHPRILAWELFNEPEYDIWGNKIPLDAAQATVKLLASTAHAHTANAVTLGSATLEGILMWTGLGLDFYSPHWYDNMSSGLACARCTDLATVRNTFGADGLPIVVGEFQGGPEVDAQQRLKDFRAKGYAGAWAWSLFPDKTQDHLKIDLGAYAKFAADPGSAPVQTAAQANVQLLANWVSPTYLLPGQTVTVNQDAMSDSNTSVLVDFEIYNGQGQQILQTALDNQPLTMREVTSFSTTFTLPNSLPPGRYTVKTGAFAPGRGAQYAWSDTAGVFVVDVAPPTPTPSAPAPDDEGDWQPDQADSN